LTNTKPRERKPEVSLLLDGGRELSGRCIELTAADITLLFAHDTLELGANDTVALRLQREFSAHPLDLEATVVEVQRGARGQRVTLRFVLSDTQTPELLLESFEFLNRRSCFRVRPTETSPVQATILGLTTGTRIKTDKVTDLSVENIGLRLPKTQGARFKGDETVRIGLTFPPSNETITFIARVDRREENSRRIELGLSIDAEATPDLEAHQARVREYVLEQQRRALELRVG